jgi:hypothetical protein
MEEVDIVIIVLKKLLLSILYGRSCYCQYYMEEVVIVNIVWRKLLFMITYGIYIYIVVLTITISSIQYRQDQLKEMLS